MSMPTWQLKNIQLATHEKSNPMYNMHPKV